MEGEEVKLFNEKMSDDGFIHNTLYNGESPIDSMLSIGKKKMSSNFSSLYTEPVDT